MASKANATFEGRLEETTTPLPTAGEAVSGTDVPPAEESTTSTVEETTVMEETVKTDTVPTDAEGKE